ncbi:MAG: response regulator transcription factor [Dehalococcoidales bacterium]|nr:response regulator transcription factor [Dehalococcoidales bacterium]
MKVLIIEDDREIVEIITLAFEIRWPGVTLVTTHLGIKGVELVEAEDPDVVILDLGLPDTNGFDVLKEIRTFSDIPVMILTVRGEEADVVKGLEWGADDYMVKPFRQLELLSRIKALTRRSSNISSETTLVHGDLRFNPTVRQLFRGDEEIMLTRTEGTILFELMKNSGQVVTHNNLAEAVWGEDYPDAVDSLRVYIRRLREKIESNPDTPELILTKTGLGYMLAKQG